MRPEDVGERRPRPVDRNPHQLVQMRLFHRDTTLSK
jgi:hypothetical protein